MRFRKLRIAWSVVWGLAAVLLIVLWVRSYSTLDNIAGHLLFNPAVSCTSAYGRLGFGKQNVKAPWKFSYHNSVLDEKSFGGRPKEPRKWFMFQRMPFATSISVPHGFFASLALAAGITPWLPWRFSLRTLLIATTLVAVMLGAMVYAAR
jgi:hypothetical protein